MKFAEVPIFFGIFIIKQYLDFSLIFFGLAKKMCYKIKSKRNNLFSSSYKKIYVSMCICFYLINWLHSLIITRT